MRHMPRFAGNWGSITLADKTKNCVSRMGDRRVVRTKRAIREAFLNLLHAEDYDRVTITAVAHEADIDRKTFYLHYDSVDDVLDEIIRERAEQIVASLREESLAQGGGVDVADLFARLSVALVQDYSITENMVRRVSSEKLLNKVEGPLTEAIVECDALGLASAMGPYLSFGVSFLCGGLLSAYRHWLAIDSDVPLENLAALTSAAILSGVEGFLQGVPIEAK
ncbi:TetR/AcrR family transcriptional regulator [Gordonibacter sp. 28C]|nr:TetR/AcrR family transcriptional regulator [Gordonibacter sp. 28C]